MLLAVLLASLGLPHPARENLASGPDRAVIDRIAGTRAFVYDRSARGEADAAVRSRADPAGSDPPDDQFAAEPPSDNCWTSSDPCSLIEGYGESAHRGRARLARHARAPPTLVC